LSYLSAMPRLSASDYQAALEVLYELADVDGPNPFPEPVLDALRRLVPCDVVTYHEKVAVYAPLAQTGKSAGVVTSAFREAHERWWDQSPLKPARGAQMYSDHLTQRQFHRMELYHDLARPLGVDDMIRLWIDPTGAADGARLEFDRTDWGFRERDRDVLNVILPHLERFRRRAARRHARTQTPPADVLTRRQSEILELVAEGKTNSEIARLLWISPHTVRKHLENAYASLGVHTRTGALAATRPQDDIDVA
jgi:DNA-binding CsgD family transcriptional regulator